MTGGRIENTVHDTGVSVVSGITSEESTNLENALSIEEKKRKLILLTTFSNDSSNRRTWFVFTFWHRAIKKLITKPLR